MRKPQLLVVGYNAELCTSKVYSLAYEVGREIARRGIILVTGGLGGVMEAASKGAKEEGGLVVAIIPQDEPSQANHYSDVVIPTGIGYARDFITANSADAVIVVGGGVGTLIEACAAYLKAKPIIALRGSGGVADEFAGEYLDERRTIRVEAESTPKAAVEKALSLIKSPSHAIRRRSHRSNPKACTSKQSSHTKGRIATG